jgi:hypothetical protein
MTSATVSSATVDTMTMSKGGAGLAVGLGQRGLEKSNGRRIAHQADDDDCAETAAPSA